MPLSADAERRDLLLQAIGNAMATLRSATSTINVAENVPGAIHPVTTAREIGANQISLIRIHLDQLEPLVKG